MAWVPFVFNYFQGHYNICSNCKGIIDHYIKNDQKQAKEKTEKPNQNIKE